MRYYESGFTLYCRQPRPPAESTNPDLPAAMAPSPADARKHPSPPGSWIPLSASLGLMVRKKQLFGWSFLLFVITILLTWLGYTLIVGYVDSLTGSFLNNPPATDSIWGWLKYSGWTVGKWLLLIISRIIAFYLSFLFAYSLTTPGYVFLSTAAEKLHLGEHFNPEDAFTLRGVMTDLIEGVKIGVYGILVSLAALLVSFIPVLGLVLVFLIYTFYSALMFIDYPASRRRWTLRRKINWLVDNRRLAFRIGFLPAVLSMVPLLNIFLMALLFPVLTIHATLNFARRQQHPDILPGQRGNLNGN
jgi:CysZ protein